MQEYHGAERRKDPHLSEEILDAIADRAADKAVKKMTDEAYKAIGKGILSRLFYLAGVITVATYFWLQAKGVIK